MTQSFSAVTATNCKVLILGSMPGVASLQAQQYYAHPRNAFWSIMQKYTKVQPDADYYQRITQLTKHHIALWDVIAHCERPGSLDNDIITSSIRVNDFDTLFKTHKKLKFIGLNGNKAFQLFKQHIVKQHSLPKHIHYACLPSTSPAHARLTLQEKKINWHQQLDVFLT